MLQIDEQYIHTTITDLQTHLEIYFTFVYGLHTVDDRRSLWSSLQTIAATINNSPWGIAWDFNAVLHLKDRENGAPVSLYEIGDFEEFLQTSGCAELQMRGSYFTWSNKGHGTARISSRIDRMLGNAKWLEVLAETEVVVGLPGISDHSPIVITLPGHVVGGGRPFKFLNYMADHTKFEEVVTLAWQKKVPGNPMIHVWYKLQATKQELKKLHEEEFGRVHEKIAATREILQSIQQQLSSDRSNIALQAQEKEQVEN